jgi:cell division protein FtsB
MARKRLTPNEYISITMEQRIDRLEKDRCKLREQNEMLKKENEALKDELRKVKELLYANDK